MKILLKKRKKVRGMRGKGNINPKILVGIVTVVIAAIIIAGALTYKRNLNLKPQPTPAPQLTLVKAKKPLPTPPAIALRQSTAPASKVSSDTIPVAKRSYSKFTDGVVVSFNSTTNILTLSTKDQPAWQIPLDSSIKLYQDIGMANIVKIQPSELTKGSSVSVQKDAKTDKITQITITAKI